MKFKVLISSLLILCTTVITALGTEFQLDLDTSVVTITGQIDSLKSNQIITIQVLPKGSVLDSLSDTQLGDSYIYQTTTDEEGRYVFDFKMISRTGDYTYYINEGTNSEHVTGDFYFSNPDDLGDTIEDIDDAIIEKDAVALQEICENNKDLLGIDFPTDKLPTDISKIYEYIVRNYTSVGNSNVLGTAYLEGAILQKINEVAIVDEIKAIISNNLTIVDLNSCSAYPAYEALVEDGHGDLVMDNLLNKSFEDYDKLYYTFNVASILTTVQKKSWVAIKPLITANNQILELNLTEYEKYSDIVDREVAGKYYSSMDDFVTEVKEIIDEKSNESTGGSGSGKDRDSDKPKSKGSFSVNNSFLINQQAPQVEKTDIEFGDIASVDWAKDSISFLANKGAITGKAKGLFVPNDSITREEYLKILLLAFDINPGNNVSCSFDDVNQGEWYYPYIAQAYEMGLVNGKGNIFGVGETITRQDMAVIAYRIAKMKGFKGEGTGIVFEDSNQISDYAKESIGVMSANGILNGMGNNLFKADNNATRAEASKVIHKLFILVTEGVQ